MKITVTVNGTPYNADVSPRLLLVDFLRDTLGLTGTKIGDETGYSGADTVLLKGVSVKSSLVLAAQADGGEVTTVEGLAQNGALSPLQQAFWENHAVQNGFSTPGILMSLTDLLQRNCAPTEAEIRSWLDGTLCRITGYHNIVRAVEAAVHKTKGVAPEEKAPPAHVVGAPLKTKEAPALIRGEARFIGDISLPDMVHAAILFSEQAHARIKRIDTGAAEAMPGVVGVFTGADVNLMPLPVVWVPPGVESHFPPHPSGVAPGSQSVLAKDTVRYVGDQVAVVVAETRQQAYDALVAIQVDYEPLPVVLEAEEALKDGAPQLHETIPNNLLAHVSYGNKEATDQAIEEAEVVVRQQIHNQRMIPNTIETRGSVAHYDQKTDSYTLWTNIQPTYPVRLLITQYVLGIPYSKLRIIVPNIGGSLGSKGYLYADAPLMLYLSKVLGRPVKWIDTREGLARSTAQSRGQVQYVTLAGTKEGKITALSCKAYSNIGAYPVINAPGMPTVLIGRSITGAYDIPHPFYEVYMAYTNTVQIGPLRGSGRAEAIFLIERMMDLFAREIGMDPAAVRRKNMVKSDQFPFDNRLGWSYDSGNYEAALDKALEIAGYANMTDRKAQARRRGKRLGVGLGSYVAVAGVGPSGQMGAAGLVSGTWGSAALWVQPTGEVIITTGAQPHGQSQETTFSQIAAEELGIPMENITVLHSDTSGALYFGQASYGSRSLSVEGTAVHKAARKVKEKAIKFAAHTFKAAEEGVAYEGGKVYLKAAPDQAVMTLQQVAFMLWLAWDLPEGMDPGLEATAYFDPPNFNFPFGTHIAVVEVDEQTGHVDLVRYVAIDDFGNVVNPLVVDGQTHGNIALGVGQALFEEAVYDSKGRILTDSFKTYAIPRASHLPSFELARTVTPSPTNPLGAKGAGDVSNPAAAPAVINAICDALSDLGIRHIEMPAKPEKIWKAIEAAQRRAAP